MTMRKAKISTQSLVTEIIVGAMLYIFFNMVIGRLSLQFTGNYWLHCIIIYGSYLSLIVAITTATKNIAAPMGFWIISMFITDIAFIPKLFQAGAWIDITFYLIVVPLTMIYLLKRINPKLMPKLMKAK